MPGQKLPSRHSCTVTANTFFVSTCPPAFSKLWANPLFLKHTLCSVVHLGQNKMSTG